MPSARGHFGMISNCTSICISELTMVLSPRPQCLLSSPLVSSSLIARSRARICIIKIGPRCSQCYGAGSYDLDRQPAVLGNLPRPESSSRTSRSMAVARSIVALDALLKTLPTPSAVGHRVWHGSRQGDVRLLVAQVVYRHDLPGGRSCTWRALISSDSVQADRRRNACHGYRLCYVQC